jgi:hypothetical protein
MRSQSALGSPAGGAPLQTGAGALKPLGGPLRTRAHGAVK